MNELERENERQKRELERDRSMVAHLRNVVDLVDALELLPIDLALLALKAVHSIASGGSGPIAEALTQKAGEALLRKL